MKSLRATTRESWTASRHGFPQPERRVEPPSWQTPAQRYENVRHPARSVCIGTCLAVTLFSAATLTAAAVASVAPTVTILSPAENMALRLDQPTTLAAGVREEAQGTAARAAEFAWDLVRISDGHTFELTQRPGDPTPSPSNRSLLVTFGSLPDISEGEYWLSVRVRVPGQGKGPELAARTAIQIRLVRDNVALSGVAPGIVVAGEENVVLHGVGFLPVAELRLLGSYLDGGCASCPRPVIEPLYRNGTQCRATTARDGRTIRFVVPISQPSGTYQVAVRQGNVIVGGPMLRVVPRAITRSSGGDPHRVAWPLVSGQTIEGTFHSAADPTGTFWDFDLYYFFATAGSRLTMFLRRVDTTKSWFHPDELDPEMAVATPRGYVPQYLHGLDDRPNDDLNASLTRPQVPSTGLYVVVAATTKGAGRYELGFQLERAAPLPGESRFVIGTGLSGFVLKGVPAVADIFLFDRFGAPFSGAPVRLKAESDVPSPDFIGGLTGRTSPWGFLTVKIRTSVDGAMPGLWFVAEQGDAAYGSSMYGHERKAIAVRGRDLPAFWTSLDRLAEVNQATGEIRLSGILIKRDPHAPR